MASHHYAACMLPCFRGDILLGSQRSPCHHSISFFSLSALQNMLVMGHCISLPFLARSLQHLLLSCTRRRVHIQKNINNTNSIDVTFVSTKHHWSSGRIRPCHGRDPSSILGWCRSFFAIFALLAFFPATSCSSSSFFLLASC